MITEDIAKRQAYTPESEAVKFVNENGEVEEQEFTKVLGIGYQNCSAILIRLNKDPFKWLSPEEI